MQDKLPAVLSDGGVIECLPVVVFNPNGDPTNATCVSLGYHQQALSDAATYLVTPPTGTLYMLIRVEGEECRWLDDGTTPTSSVGMPLGVGETLVYDCDASDLLFIGTVAGSILNITSYGVPNA